MIRERLGIEPILKCIQKLIISFISKDYHTIPYHRSVIKREKKETRAICRPRVSCIDNNKETLQEHQMTIIHIAKTRSLYLPRHIKSIRLNKDRLSPIKVIFYLHLYCYCCFFHVSFCRPSVLLPWWALIRAIPAKECFSKCRKWPIHFHRNKLILMSIFLIKSHWLIIFKLKMLNISGKIYIHRVICLLYVDPLPIMLTWPSNLNILWLSRVDKLTISVGYRISVFVIPSNQLS
jgi:hypothetical protein